MLDRLYIRRKVEEFLAEDIGHQDLTTDNLDTDRHITAEITVKEDGILCGIDIASVVMEVVDPGLTFRKIKGDGQKVKSGDIVGTITGSGKSILKGERVMLNLLQRMSGISTNTAKFVEKIRGTPAKILDTRKTTPGLRAFEKYAVSVGGGKNHRFALFDMVMIKDNHIALAGGIKEAVQQIKEKVSPFTRIEVEVSDLEQFSQALELDVDIIMLDNFTVEMVREAVKINKNRKMLEASGNINLENIREYALTGVDFISSGALIHSARWLDISLKFK
ncbi:carboxylating nicotinate-nucleotide diphosphorylase [Persephonella sp.]